MATRTLNHNIPESTAILKLSPVCRSSTPFTRPTAALISLLTCMTCKSSSMLSDACLSCRPHNHFRSCPAPGSTGHCKQAELGKLLKGTRSTWPRHEATCRLTMYRACHKFPDLHFHTHCMCTIEHMPGPPYRTFIQMPDRLCV